MTTLIRIKDPRTAKKIIGHGGSTRHLLMFLLLASATPMLMAASATTSTTLAVAAKGLPVSSVDAGAVVTLTATVKAGSSAVAVGQVNFCDAAGKLCSDIHLLGTASLSTAGKAVFAFVPRPGAHEFKAEFIGTQSDTASTSSEEPLLVYGATKTTIAATGSTGNYTLKATVTGLATDAAPAGDVEFKDTNHSNDVLATAALGAGTSAVAWTNTQNPATKPRPLSIAVADFNGDGISDIAIGTNSTSAGYLGILLGNGNGTFQAAKSFTGLPNNQAIAVAPFVTGGPLDILTVSNNTTGTNNAAVFLGDGKGGGSLKSPFNLGGLSSVTALAAADFDRDGKLDYVVGGLTFGVYAFATASGNGDGTFGGPTVNAIGSNPLLVAVGAFGKSGYPDVAVADTGSDALYIFQNNGQGLFFATTAANTGANPTAMVTGDFNGDGYLDLAVVSGTSDEVTVYLGKGNYTLTAGATVATGHSPTSIAVGDFNEDGIADLAVVNSADKTVSILLGKGNGTFTAAPSVATGLNPVNVATGDFSGAGPADLAVTNQDTTATTASTLTVQAAALTQTATATATKVAPAGAGAHLVDATYVGDSLYNTSASSTVSLNGSPAPAATPTFSLAGGSYSSAQKITITDTTKGAVIYYTTNGTTPTTSSTKYSSAITVSASETIEAIAVLAGYSNSKVASAKYVIATALPVFKPAGGTYSSAQKVTLTDTTKGAVIYYTTNGTTPTTGSTKYTAAIAVSKSEIVKAIAVAPGYANSGVSSAVYTIK